MTPFKMTNKGAPPPPREFNPQLKISRQVEIALETLLSPCIGKPVVPARTMRAVREILQGLLPNRSVRVTNVTDLPARRSMVVNLIAYVDNVADVGLVIGRRKPDGSIYGTPANDT